MSELLSAIVRTWWRYFVTGHPVRGERRDNATFLFAASQDMRGKPYEKLSGPIWHRLARRWAVLGVPLLFLALSAIASAVQLLPSPDAAWTRIDWFGMAFRWWIIGAAVLLGYGIYRAVQLIRTREVRREFVGPAWEAACDAMGYRFRMSDAPRMVELPDDFEPPDTDPATRGRLSALVHAWLERRRDAEADEDEDLPALDDEDTSEPSTDLVPVADAELEPYKPPPWARILPPRRPVNEDIREEPVRIILPPGKCSTTAEKNRFTQKVGPVLGMPDPVPEWDRRGRWVDLRPNHPPPPTLTFEEFRPYLKEASIDKVPIGLSHGKKVAYINFILDSAHALLSAASNTGKTNLVKLICAIMMHFGAALVVLDFKVVSHRWAHKLPGCDYAWDIPDIHDLLVAIGAEIYRRKTTAIPDGADVDTPLNSFPTLVVLVEEQNALSEQLRDYWTANRQPGQPVQSPALAALRAVVYTGREFGVRVISVAQRASANTFGSNGGDARESFSIRLMADWTLNTWKMLAGGIPFIRCPKGVGIFARVQSDGDVAIIRVPKISDREALDLAMSGVPSPGQALGEVITETGLPVKQAEMVEPEMVTLRTAAEGNMLPGSPLSWEALRKAAQRDSRFPEPAGMAGVAITYRLADLRDWKDARDGVRPLALVGTRPGVVYRIDTLDPETGAVELGYIGQTRQRLSKREDQHRGDKPWSDLIVGSPVAIWERDTCSNEELDDAERDAIHRLRPRYNYKEQEGAAHAMPLWEQVEQRQARQRARGLPPWEPEDRYQMSHLSQAGIR